MNNIVEAAFFVYELSSRFEEISCNFLTREISSSYAANFGNLDGEYLSCFLETLLLGRFAKRLVNLVLFRDKWGTDAMPA